MLIPYGSSNIELNIVADLLLAGECKQGPTIVAAVSNPCSGQIDLTRLRAATSICIVVPDNTRPAAHRRVLPELLPLLLDKTITIVVACGAHGTPDSVFLQEIMQLLPNAALHVHDCDNSPMTSVGQTTRGTPVIVNDILLGSELMLGIGSVAIHPFAGLSGGPKAFVPGCAARSTITANHSLLLNKMAAPGRLEDNPLYNDLTEAVDMLSEPLIINEALSPGGTPVGYYFGRVATAHRAAAALALSASAIPLGQPYDMVIASAGGTPRDINLYQAIKALEMSALACRPGGKLILLAECAMGIGSKLYEEWAQRSTAEQEEMVRSRFTVGAHKAFLATRALNHLAGAVLVSELPPALVSSMG